MSDDAGPYQREGECGSSPTGSVGQIAISGYVSDEIAPRDRASVWRDRISDLLMEVEIRPDAPSSGYDNVVVARPLGDLLLLKMNFAASQIVRKDGRGEGARYFLMHVNFSGVAVASSMGRLLTLNEGEAVVLDGAQPFTIHRQETGSSYVVRIPRERMAQLAFLPETVVMRKLPIAAGPARLVTAYMDAVLTTAQTPPRVHRLTYRHFSDLLTLLLDPTDAAIAEGADAPGIAIENGHGSPRTRFQAARSYVAEHAHDQISIGQLAVHLGITERHAQRLFESHGTTFTAMLNEVRLARAHALLCDPTSDKLRIRSICFKAGFRDVSHFNRIFRARYGCTPADVRKTRCGSATR